MPKINVLQVRRSLQREYAAQGERLSTRQADRLLAEAFDDASFREWLERIDLDDASQFGSLHEPHSDTTARRAIMRVLREQFNAACAA